MKLLRTHKVYIILFSLSIITLLAVFLIHKNPVAAPMNSQSDYAQRFLGYLKNTPIPSLDKRGLITAYCTALTHDDMQQGLLDSKGMYFSPRHSLFVATLCKPLIKTSTFYNTKILHDAPWDGIISLDPACETTGSMSDCDLSRLLPALFAVTMNDHSTLAVAGWTATSKDPKEAASMFSDTYFGNLIKTCGGETKNKYISSESPTNEQSAICSHPKTYATLENAISELQKQISKMKLVDGARIADKTTDACKKGQRASDMFVCAYNYGSTSDRGGDQYNLRYNELLYYKLLISRLTTKLQDPNYTPLNLTKVYLTQDKAAMTSSEIQRLSREVTLSENAVDIMQRSINSIRATLPLHIGLLAYYEDILSVRKSLVKIYTPINQLYYKLRNVQKKE